ncbi:hypothetical protein [Helicobacter ganmani]|uniref:hypothetical protein n=1 Tax=Helicobacter ganmani TaxID=60246 RepID=UPI003A873AB3
MKSTFSPRSTPTPSTNRDIFTRDLSGELIDMNDPEFERIKEIILETIRLTSELNSGHHSAERVRELFSQIIGKEVDCTLGLSRLFMWILAKILRWAKISL